MANGTNGFNSMKKKAAKTIQTEPMKSDSTKANNVESHQLKNSSWPEMLPTKKMSENVQTKTIDRLVLTFQSRQKQNFAC